MSLFDIIASITPVDDFKPTGESTSLHIPYYCLRPCDDCSSYEQVIREISDNLEDNVSDNASDNPSEKDIKSDLSKFTEPIQPAKQAAQWTIFVKITYPVENDAMFKVVFQTHIGQLNLAMLHIAHATAYKLMYDIEDGTTTVGLIPVMFNRQTSSGLYGIWGSRD